MTAAPPRPVIAIAGLPMIDLTITSLDADPIARIPYRSARAGGGAERGELALVPVRVPALPVGVDAILIAGDLQARSDDPRRLLLGEVLAEVLFDLAADARVPALDRIGVILAGDLFAAPAADARGASGCVVPVWEAFACVCRWVVGVLGNHDTLGDPGEQQRFRALRRAHLLDGTTATLDGMIVAGVSGIVGPVGKAQRRPEKAYLAELARVAPGADVLVLHESPSGAWGQLGRDAIRDALAPTRVPFLFSGHCHWPEPRATIGATQVVNVDGRALLLTR